MKIPAALFLSAVVAASADMVLLNGSLDHWRSFDSGGSGEVAVEDGVVVIGMGNDLSGIIYENTAALRPVNYEISLEVQRLNGNDFPCALTFPFGDWTTCASLVIGGWGGGVVGISSLNGLDASENGATKIIPIKDRTWYKIRLRVTNNRIQAWIDGKKEIDVDTTGMKVAPRPGPIEAYLPLSLTTYQTKGAIRNMTWKEVGGPEE